MHYVKSKGSRRFLGYGYAMEIFGQTWCWFFFYKSARCALMLWMLQFFLQDPERCLVGVFM